MRSLTMRASVSVGAARRERHDHGDRTRWIRLRLHVRNAEHYRERHCDPQLHVSLPSSRFFVDVAIRWHVFVDVAIRWHAADCRERSVAPSHRCERGLPCWNTRTAHGYGSERRRAVCGEFAPYHWPSRAIRSRPAFWLSVRQSAVAETYPSSAGNLKVETVAQRARSSLGARLPARRPHAGHRAAGAACASSARTASCRRRVAGVPKVVASRPGRPARRRARPRLRAEPDDLFLLRRAGERRRPHRAGARAGSSTTANAAARRREGDLPPGRPAVERQSFRLPHRAGAATATCS